MERIRLVNDDDGWTRTMPVETLKQWQNRELKRIESCVESRYLGVTFANGMVKYRMFRRKERICSAIELETKSIDGSPSGNNGPGVLGNRNKGETVAEEQGSTARGLGTRGHFRLRRSAKSDCDPG